MLLFDYLESASKLGITRKHIAYRIGISVPNLIKISYGTSCPSLIIAYRIVEYTRGEVSYHDLLSPYIAKHTFEASHDGIIRTGVNPKAKSKGKL